MGKKLGFACILVLLIPYIVTLAWTGTMEGSKQNATEHSGRQIQIDRGNQGSYLDAEVYLIGILAAQISPSYESEALKAQAIIARTYLYKQMGKEKEIAESALDMDYLDGKQMEKLFGNDMFVSSYEALEAAVKDTSNMVMTYDGTYIDPLFHRASAGSTRAGDESHPYLQVVSSHKDFEMEDFMQISSWTKEEFVKRMNEITGEESVTIEQIPESIQLIEKDESGYVEQIQIGSRSYSGDEVQHALGLVSPAFVLEAYEDEMRAITKGIGHGYGMSQYGANVKAKEGLSAEEILSYFYKNIVIIPE